MYGEECWVTKKQKEAKVHVVEMHMLRWMNEAIRTEGKNVYIRFNLPVASIEEIIKKPLKVA